MAAKKKKAPAAKTTKAASGAAAFLSDLHASKGVDEGLFSLYGSEFAAQTKVTEWVSTGSLALDKLIGGGWPIGRITELAAWEGVGKSTILDQSIAMVQRQGGLAILIDSEHARDEDYTVRLGVKIDDVIKSKIYSLEDGFESLDHILAVQEARVRKLKTAPPPLLIVWDSLGGTPPRAELEGDAGDAHVGVAARKIRQALRRLNLRLPVLRSAFVVSNHFYQEIGGHGALKTSGGNGMRYFSSLRVWLTRTGSIKIGDTEIGHSIQAKLKKTRISKPKPPVEIGLVYGAGIDNAYTLHEWGKQVVHEKGRWVEQRGAWSALTLPDGTSHNYQRSFVGLGQLFAEHPPIYSAMAAAYMAHDEV